MTKSPPKQPIGRKPRKTRNLPKTSLVKKFGINLTKHIPEDVIQSHIDPTEINMEIENLSLNKNEPNK